MSTGNTQLFVCKQCQSDNAVSIRWVGELAVDLYCDTCKQRIRVQLPQLNKIVIILDTNAVSEIMKSINPEFPEERRKKLKPEWVTVYKLLKEAVRLQAIVCPQSPTLKIESKLSKFGPAIIETAKSIDGEVKSHSVHEICCQQLHLAAKAYHKKTDVEQLGRSWVYSGKLNRWLDLFRIEITGWQDFNPPDVVRANRKAIHALAQRVFENWKNPNVVAESVFQEECMSWGPMILRQYAQVMGKHARQTATFEDFFSTSAHLVSYLRHGFQSAGAPYDEALDLAFKFLMSTEAGQIPNVQIGAALYAFEAFSVSRGMKPPKPSMWKDVEMISSMLPYCDVMLIESHFAEILKQSLRLLPDYCKNAMIFSTSNLLPFCKYLEEVISKVDPAQKMIADRIYNW